jgi:hypothetical protein
MVSWMPVKGSIDEDISNSPCRILRYNDRKERLDTVLYCNVLHSSSTASAKRIFLCTALLLCDSNVAYGMDKVFVMTLYVASFRTRHRFVSGRRGPLVMLVMLALLSCGRGRRIVE